MKLTHKIFLLILILLICSMVCAAQQESATKPTAQATNSSLSPEESKLLGDLLIAEQEVRLYALAPEEHKDKAGAATRLVTLYGKAAQHPALSQLLIGLMLNEYSSLRESARGAAQISQAADEAGIKFRMLTTAQNQILIEQNNRIINLLEQLVKKR